MGVAACLLLEYGVSTAAVAVGWSGYLNLLLDNLFGWQIRNALRAAPWDAEPGSSTCPRWSSSAMCMLLLIRGARESAKVNAMMVVIKLACWSCSSSSRSPRSTPTTSPTSRPTASPASRAAAGTIFFTFIGLDAVSTAGDEVKDPQKTMPRAILARSSSSSPSTSGVAVAALGTQPWQEFDPDQAEAGLAKILENVTAADLAGDGPRRRRGDLDLLGDPGDAVRADPHPVRDGPRRPAAARSFARVNPRTHTPVNNTVIVAVVVGLLAAFVPLDYLWDLVSIGTLDRVHRGVPRRDHPAPYREPDLPRGFKVPGYPVTPMLAVAGLRLHPVRPAVVHMA